MLPVNAASTLLALVAAVDCSEEFTTLAASVRTPTSVLLVRCLDNSHTPALVVLPPFGQHLRALLSVELLADTGKYGKDPPSLTPSPIVLLRTLTARYQSRLPKMDSVAPLPRNSSTTAATTMAQLRRTLLERERDAAEPMSWEDLREADNPFDPAAVVENDVMRITLIRAAVVHPPPPPAAAAKGAKAPPPIPALYELAVAHHAVLTGLAADVWASARNPFALYIGRGSYAVRAVENAQTLKPFPPSQRPHVAIVDRVVLKSLGEVSGMVTRRLVRTAAIPVPMLDRTAAMLIVPSVNPNTIPLPPGTTAAPADEGFSEFPLRAARLMVALDEPLLLRPPLGLWGQLGHECALEAIMSTARRAPAAVAAPPPPLLATDATPAAPAPPSLKRANPDAELQRTLGDANARKRRRLVMDTLEYTFFVRAVAASNQEEALKRYSNDIFSTWVGNGCPSLRSEPLATALRAHAIAAGFAPYSSTIRAFDKTVGYVAEPEKQ